MPFSVNSARTSATSAPPSESLASTLVVGCARRAGDLEGDGFQTAAGAHDERALDGDFDDAGRAEISCGAGARAVGQHDRGDAGVGGRGQPCVQTSVGVTRHGAEAEGGGDAIPGAVAGGDDADEGCDEGKGAQSEGITAVGAWRRAQNVEAGDEAAQTIAMGLPQHAGGGVAGVDGQRVVVGCRWAMGNSGRCLHAAQGLVAVGQARSDHRHDDAEGGGGEQGEAELVAPFGQLRPHAGQRDENEKDGESDQEPCLQPDLLEGEGDLAAVHLVLKFRGQGGFALGNSADIAIRHCAFLGCVPGGVLGWLSSRRVQPIAFPEKAATATAIKSSSNQSDRSLVGDHYGET